MRSKWVAIISSLLIFTGISKAWGYGSNFHQLNNVASAHTVQKVPLRTWLGSNILVLQRLGETPDRYWKVQGPPSDNEGFNGTLLGRINAVEHQLHFQELDALLKFEEILNNPRAIDRLPTGRFKDVATDLLKLLAERAEDLNRVEPDPKKQIEDPKHPTIAELARHGVAAWRILQLHDLAVDTLKKGDQAQKNGNASEAKQHFKLALLYLGVAGHYIADLTQPFHGTINYDGQIPDANGLHVEGLHSAFESSVPDVLAGDVGEKADSQTHLWPSFKTSEAGVMKAAQEVYTTLDHGVLSGELIVRTAHQTVISGYPYIPPIIKIFSDLKLEHIDPISAQTIIKDHGEEHLNEHFIQHEPTSCRVALNSKIHHNGYVPREAIRKFSASMIKVAGKDPISVFDFLQRRLGLAVAHHAQFMESAYQAAGNPDLTNAGRFTLADFDEHFLRDNYPFPDFFPKEP